MQLNRVRDMHCTASSLGVRPPGTNSPRSPTPGLLGPDAASAVSSGHALVHTLAAAADMALRVLFVVLHNKSHRRSNKSASHSVLSHELRTSVTRDMIAEWSCPDCARTSRQYCEYVRLYCLPHVASTTQTSTTTLGGDAGCANSSMVSELEQGSAVASYLYEVTKNSLLTVLLSPMKEFHNLPAPRTRVAVFGGIVHNSSAWQALWCIIGAGDALKQRDSLHDVTAIVVRRSFNCASLTSM